MTDELVVNCQSHIIYSSISNFYCHALNFFASVVIVWWKISLKQTKFYWKRRFQGTSCFQFFGYVVQYFVQQVFSMFNVPFATAITKPSRVIFNQCQIYLPLCFYKDYSELHPEFNFGIILNRNIRRSGVRSFGGTRIIFVIHARNKTKNNFFIIFS